MRPAGADANSPTGYQEKNAEVIASVFFVFVIKGSRARKGAAVMRKSCGLSNRERSESAEKADGGRQMRPAGADANSPTGYQEKNTGVLAPVFFVFVRKRESNGQS
jgi:hypothetical protein